MNEVAELRKMLVAAKAEATAARKKAEEIVDATAPGEPWEPAAKLLFGSVARFRIGAWIACRADTPFYPSLIAEETGRYRSDLVSNPVYNKFVELEMLSPINGNDGRALWYRRVENPYWEIFRVAAHVFGTGDIVGHSWEDQMKETLLKIWDRLP